MPKIRELINFEPIKDVIDIDASFDAAEMVKTILFPFAGRAVGLCF